MNISKLKNFTSQIDSKVNFETEFFFLFQKKKKKIVGWFRFRKEATFKPSIRDLNVHKNFKDYLSQIGVDAFIFGLFTQNIV